MYAGMYRASDSMMAVMTSLFRYLCLIMLTVMDESNVTTVTNVVT